MAMESQYFPGSPCVADINGMFVGKVIYICGEVHDNADRFAIDLTCGPDSNDDIALHINPRFPAREIVRNTRQGGWGPEERDGPEGKLAFPFRRGKRFGIKITCREDGYEFSSNGYKVHSIYKHRIPFHLVTHVMVRQDCDVVLMCADILGVDLPLLAMEQPSSCVGIPFHNIRGHSVVFVGKPIEPDGRFAFNFCNTKADKIHFHFNPRLNQKQIVRNTNNGGWGSEERDLPFEFPFKENAPFQVKISVDRKGYHVEINGMAAFTYEKRLKALKTIDVIEIQGEVEIEKIMFC